MSTNKGNVLLYNLNGFKFLGKIEYDYENKKKYLLNNHEKIISKSALALENLYKDKKQEKSISSTFFIRNLFIDEESDLALANYSDNSINIFPYSTSIKNNNGLLGSKYKKDKNIFKLDIYDKIQYNLELKGNLNINQNNFFIFSHFEKITDICWLNNNYKSFITSSTDQSLMLWNYRGDKWVNHYFDLLKIFDKNLNNFQNQVLNEDQKFSLEKGRNPNYYENEEKDKRINEISLFKIKYFINVIISHPKRNDIIITGDNKGNIYQFDCDLKEQPKKLVVGSFAINSLSFSRNGNFLAVGFTTGNVILVDFNNNCKFCSIIEEYNNDDNEIKERIRKNMILSYCHIFKKFTYIDNIPNINSIDNNFNNIFKNSEYENSTIKILSMNSYKSLRIQVIKKSLFSNNINQYNNLNKHSDFNYHDKKNVNGNIPNNYFNSTIKNLNYNYKIKKIEMHVSEDYLIILFDNSNILINRIESNSISGIITLNNHYLEFYDIKSDSSGLYLAVLSDAFANQESFDFQSIENNNDFYSEVNHENNINYDKRESNFNFSSNQNFNSLDKNRSIEFKSNVLRPTEHKIIDNNLYKSTFTSGLDKGAEKTLIELSTVRDNIRKKSSIIIYEIGTGNFVCILKNLFVIANFKFSNDGRFLCVTSDSGCVSVWNTSGEIRENIFSISEEIKINPNFWDSFRINFCLENADKFDFFQIENQEKNKNNGLIKSIHEKKNLNRLSKDEEKRRKNHRNEINKITNFSPSIEKKSIGKKTFSRDKKKTDSNTNIDTNNSPSNLNKAKLTTTNNYNDTSYKSLYLNNNTNNYKNSSRLINAKSSEIEENLLNRSSRGKIFSNYPIGSKNNYNIEFKNSNSSIDKKMNKSPKGKQPNMLYSSSNLYKKSFQLEEFVNLDNRASKANLKSFDKGSNFINNNNNEIFNKDRQIVNSQIVSSKDYLINFSKEKMSVIVYTDPEDIDDLVDENLADYGNIVSRLLVNQIGLNPIPDNIITEEFFENSKIKGSTADQIEFIDNNINNFEKNILKNIDVNNTSYSKNSRNDHINKDNPYKRSYLKDSIDN